MTEEDRLEVGDTVQLKQGGQLMTVVNVGSKGYDDYDEVYCEWLVFGKVVHHKFKMAALQKVSRNQIRLHSFLDRLAFLASAFGKAKSG